MSSAASSSSAMPLPPRRGTLAYARAFCRSSSCESRKTLSTPIASTRKGITSAMMSVTLTPTVEKMATDVDTLRRTMKMPQSPAPRLAVACLWLRKRLTKSDLRVYQERPLDIERGCGE